MKLQDCEKEIKDGHYLIASEMEQQSGHYVNILLENKRNDILCQ